MSIKTYDPNTGTGLFPALGYIFGAMEFLNRQRGTDAPAFIANMLTDTQTLSVMAQDDLENLQSIIYPGLAAHQDNYATMLEVLREFARDYLIQTVVLDSADLAPTLADCLPYLVKQMQNGATTGGTGTHVPAHTVSATVAADAGNAGDLSLVTCLNRGDGHPQQNIFAEVITAEVTSKGTATVPPTLTLTGQVAADTIMAPDWPKGSAISRTLAVVDASNSLVDNADFADAEDANIPDGWILKTGIPGTDVKLTTLAVQTVSSSSLVVSGTFALSWNDGTRTHYTPRLAYDAAAADVEAALQTIPGLESVTVASSSISGGGTIYTVTFTDAPGNPAMLGVQNNTSGTISINDVTSGSSGALRGKALQLVGDGATAHDLLRPVWLQPDVNYVFHVRACRSAANTSGNLLLHLASNTTLGSVVDGAGNTFLSITPCSCLVVAGTSVPSQTPLSLTFRASKTTAMPCYLRISVTAAISVGGSVYINRPLVAAPLRLYDGGPYVAAFAGVKPAALGDKYTVSTTNNRAAPNFQDYFERCFRLSALGLSLPTTEASTATICPSSLIVSSSSLL